MNKLKGLASDVKHRYEGGEYGRGWCSEFLLQGRLVSLNLATSCAAVTNGEEIEVVGVSHREFLEALAYRNLAREENGHVGYVLWICFGFVFALFGGFALLSLARDQLFLTILTAAFCALLGAVALVRGTRVRAAMRALRNEA